MSSTAAQLSRRTILARTGAVGVAAVAALAVRQGTAEAAGGGEGLIYNAVNEGLANNGTDVTSALTTLMATANSAAATANGRAVIYFPNGTYGLQPGLAIPERVSLRGESRRGVRLKNLGTAGGDFLLVRGSGIDLRSLTVDGQRAAQTTHPAGSAAIVVAKPDGTTGGSRTIPGGLLLTSSVAAGATSLSVSSASFGGTPVLAGDAITLSGDGISTEIVRVSETYISGTTIPLTSSVVAGYTTSAYVAVLSTENSLEDLYVRAVEFVGVNVTQGFACRIKNNLIRDFKDAGLKVGGHGTRNCNFLGNDIESEASYGIFVDSAGTLSLGYSREIVIANNHIRLFPGAGSDACIGVADAGPVTLLTITDNVLDVTRGGTSGVSLHNDLARHCLVSMNIILCGGRSGTFGVTHRGGSVPTDDVGTHVHGNTIYGAATAVDLQSAISGLVVDNSIVGPGGTAVGVAVANSSSTGRSVSVLGNHITNVQTGVRATGSTPTTSPRLSVFDNAIQASSATIAGSAGWAMRTDDSPAGRPDTTLAGAPALEIELNAIKAALRKAGVLAP